MLDSRHCTMDIVLVIIIINCRCIFFLSITYLTEPGIIPKGNPLTIEQIRKITDTPGFSLFLLVIHSATATSSIIHIH